MNFVTYKRSLYERPHAMWLSRYGLNDTDRPPYDKGIRTFSFHLDHYFVPFHG